MATPIRPKDLDPGTPLAAADLIFDNGTQVLRANPLQIMDAARPLASQAEAEVGADNVKLVSSLRVKQAIDAQVFGDLASTASNKGAGQVGFAHGSLYAASSAGLKLQQTLNPLDMPYGATGDGTANDRTALAAADAAAYAAGRPLFITGRHKIGSNLTLLSDLAFIGGTLEPVAGTTITCMGIVTAAPQRIFAGAGGVVGIRTARPEWWGAQVNNAAFDSLAALTAAGSCVAASEGSRGGDREVLLSGGVYYISNTWLLTPTVNSAPSVRGAGTGLEGSKIVDLAGFPAAPVVNLAGSTNTSQLFDWHLKGFTIAERVANTSLATEALKIGSDSAATRLNAISSGVIENVYLFGFKRGVQFVHCNGVTLREFSAWRSDPMAAYIGVYVHASGGFTGGINFEDGCKIVSSDATVANSKCVYLEAVSGVFNAGTGANAIGGVRLNRAELYSGQTTVHLLAADGCWISDFWMDGTQIDRGSSIGVLAESNKTTANTPVIANVLLTSCYLEQSIGNQVEFRSTNGGVIRELTYSGNWSNRAQGAAVIATGTAVRGLMIDNNHIKNCNNRIVGDFAAIQAQCFGLTITGNQLERDDGASYFTHFATIDLGSNYIQCFGNSGGGIPTGTIINDNSGAVQKYIPTGSNI